MKQVLQDLRSGQTQVVDVPPPEVQPGMALVRTAVSLVSAGTERMVVDFAGKSLLGKAQSRPDLVRQVIEKARREGLLGTIEAVFNRLDQPLALGYSSAGVVEQVGEDLPGLHAGQRVACAGGGHAVHAEYVTVPRNLLVRLPEQVDYEAAAFTTLGAIALHGFRLSGAVLAERVAVIGMGLLGMLAAQIARAAGCRVFGIEVDAGRVQLAASLGLETVPREHALEAGMAFTQGAGFDALLICADTPSADPVELAGELARDRAKVVAVGAVGLQLPRKLYYEKELQFVNSRSYGPGRYDLNYEEAGQDYPPGYVRWTENRNMQAFVELLASRQVIVDPLITHRFPIQDAAKAYELITAKTRQSFLGVLLTYEPTGAEQPTLPVPTPEIRPSQAHPGAITPRPPVDQLRLGVIGAGNFAQAVMLPALRKIDSIQLVAIASASGASAQHAAKKYGFHYASGDFQKILDDPQINCVALLTRHHLHASQVIAALQAGKHVFCEKPLALDDAELDEIQTTLSNLAEERAEVCPLLSVGFNRRFAPLVQRLMKFYEGRREPLVAHYRLNAGSLPLSHWLYDPQQGGGRLIGEGCHFIDLLSFLAGAPPVAVTARGLPDGGQYNEDNVLVCLEFPDGSLGLLSYLANGDKAFGKERLEVFCAGRVAVLDDFRSLELVHQGRRQTMRSSLRQDKGHLAEWQAFSQALITGTAPPIPYDHLFGVMRATFAALRALRSGERVVVQPG